MRAVIERVLAELYPVADSVEAVRRVTLSERSAAWPPFAVGYATQIDAAAFDADAEEDPLAGWVIDSPDIDCEGVLFLQVEGSAASTNGIWLLRSDDGRGYLLHWDDDGIWPRQVVGVVSAADPHHTEPAVEALFVEAGAWPSIATRVAADEAGEAYAMRVAFNPGVVREQWVRRWFGDATAG